MTVEIIFKTHQSSIDNELGIATGWMDGVQGSFMGIRSIFSQIGRSISTF
jgi:phage-related protein